jgi:hypothetical protein
MKYYIVKNIFTNKQRRELIERSKPFLLDPNMDPNNTRYYPGKQTHSDLHLLPEFRFYLNHILKIVQEKTNLNLFVQKSWVNWTNGKKKDLSWHNHLSDCGVVYYMKTVPFFSNGTLFRSGMVRSPQNSILIFNPLFEHSAPTCPFRIDRYTLALDLNIFH